MPFMCYRRGYLWAWYLTAFAGVPPPYLFFLSASSPLPLSFSFAAFHPTSLLPPIHSPLSLVSPADPYVKASLICDGRRLKKRKTSIKKNTLNPTYNEALVFDIPNENIESVSVIIAVMDYDWWAGWGVVAKMKPMIAVKCAAYWTLVCTCSVMFAVAFRWCCGCVEHDEGLLVSQPPGGRSLFYIDGHLMNRHALC